MGPWTKDITMHNGLARLAGHTETGLFCHPMNKPISIRQPRRLCGAVIWLVPQAPKSQGGVVRHGCRGRRTTLLKLFVIYKHSRKPGRRSYPSTLTTKVPPKLPVAQINGNSQDSSRVCINFLNVYPHTLSNWLPRRKVPLRRRPTFKLL